MIINPPHIVFLLKAYQQFCRHGLTGLNLAHAMAVAFRIHLGSMLWDEFIKTYHLYLQSIPLDLAKEIWGINAAKQETQTLNL